MAENEDPEKSIPWPGFVDILSTVIIVFVFFMMMTSVSIYVLSEEIKKKAVAEAVQQAKSQNEHNQAGAESKTPSDKDATFAGSQSQATPLEPGEHVSPEEINNLELEKEKLEKEIHELTQMKSVLAESASQQFYREGDTVTITYSDMGVTLQEATVDFLKQQMPFKGHVEITGFYPERQDFNAVKEIALNRALNVRNILLQTGVAHDHVTLKITARKQEEGSHAEGQYDTVSIRFAK